MKEFHCSLPYGGRNVVLVGAGASLVAVAGPAATVEGGIIMAEEGDKYIPVRAWFSLSAVEVGARERSLLGPRRDRAYGEILQPERVAGKVM